MSMTYVPILLYHRIIRPCGASQRRDPLALPIKTFERQVRYLAERGYTCVSIPDLVQALRHEHGITSRKPVAITFDDGYESVLTLAYPILREYGFTATVFVVTSHVRQPNTNVLDAPFLNWKQIRALRRNGISFGSHTVTHRPLTRLPYEGVRRELIVSKEILEHHLGEEIQTLSYPYGYRNEAVRRLARVAGYVAAFGVNKGRNGRFNLWRRQCSADDTLLTFAFKISRLYGYLTWLREESRVGIGLRRLKRSFLRTS